MNAHKKTIDDKENKMTTMEEFLQAIDKSAAEADIPESYLMHYRAGYLESFINNMLQYGDDATRDTLLKEMRFRIDTLV